MRKWILFLVALVLLLPLAPALPDEARGIVTYVIDGDTINVQGYGSVRLADVNSPELTAQGGPEAKESPEASFSISWFIWISITKPDRIDTVAISQLSLCPNPTALRVRTSTACWWTPDMLLWRMPGTTNSTQCSGGRNKKIPHFQAKKIATKKSS